jgi:hypothetical protein
VHDLSTDCALAAQHNEILTKGLGLLLVTGKRRRRQKVLFSKVGSEQVISGKRMKMDIIIFLIG